MITMSNLQAYLNDLLQCEGISDYCPNGLQVEGSRHVERIATGVTASLELIQAAISYRAHSIIVHHGLFWKGDTGVVTGAQREKIRLLLQHNISLFAYHFPLDQHQQFGNNWRAAQEMGWTDLQPFGLCNGRSIGVKGRIGPVHRDELRKYLEEYYQHPAQCAFGGRETVSSIALISGGAHKNISEAIQEGVDCFITGTADEPNWHQAREGRINFLALGHSATERIGPRALGEHLQKQFELAHQFIDIPNPF